MKAMKSMNLRACSETLLARYASGALSPRRTAAVKRHVSACPRCAHSLAEHERLGEALRGLAQEPVLAPAGFAERVLAQLPQGASAPAPQLGAAPSWAAMAATQPHGVHAQDGASAGAPPASQAHARSAPRARSRLSRWAEPLNGLTALAATWLVFRLDVVSRIASMDGSAVAAHVDGAIARGVTLMEQLSAMLHISM